MAFEAAMAWSPVARCDCFVSERSVLSEVELFPRRFMAAERNPRQACAIG